MMATPAGPSAAEIQEFFDTTRNGIVTGVRQDGSPHVSPNWFAYDGEHIYVSTKRDRAKYRIFTRDPRVVFLVDDPEARRYIGLRGTVTFREDVENVLPKFRRIRDLVGVAVPPDDEFLQFLRDDDRVLLVITPDGPPESWDIWGF
jgi:PPOX class probable F420-dependent enzyme